MMFTMFVIFLIVGVAMILLRNSGQANPSVMIGVGAASCVLAASLFLLSCFYIVNPGEVGVEILFGKVVKYAPSGLNMKNPLAAIQKMNLRTVKYEARFEGASKDLQTINVDVAINYRIDYAHIRELYNNVGPDYESKVIEPAVMNLSKAAMSQFPIADVIVKRNELSEMISSNLEVRLSNYYIILETVNLNDISFTKEFSLAVEEKQIQEQKVQTAEYRRQEAMKEKETKILQAQAEAESQRLLRSTTSREVINLKWIEKWDGKLPTYMLGNSVPMVNMPMNP